MKSLQLVFDMPTHILFTQDGKWLHYNTQTKELHTEIKIDIQNSIVVTFDEKLPYRDHYYDLKVGFKLLDFNSCSTLNFMCMKYLHKRLDKLNFNNCSPEAYRAEAIWRIWEKVSRQILKLSMLPRFELEMYFISYAYKLENRKFKVNKDAINDEIIGLRNKFKGKNILSLSEQKAILDELQINWKDLYSGKTNFSHKFLKASGDQRLIDHVEVSRAKSFKDHLMGYDTDPSNPIFSADEVSYTMNTHHYITGRVFYVNKNIQGLADRFWGEPGFKTFDYISQEMYIYLAVFNPEMRTIFYRSGYKDFYAFMYCHMKGLKVSEAEYYEDPARVNGRKMMKGMLIPLMNGMKADSICWRLGLQYESMIPFFNRLEKVMEFNKNRNSMLDTLANEKVVLISRNLGFLKSNKFDHFIKLHSEMLRITKNRDFAQYGASTFDQNILDEYAELRENIGRRIVALRIQSLGAAIIKKAVVMLMDKGYDVVLCKHDDVTVANKGDYSLCPKIMEQASTQIIGRAIPVKVS